MTVAQTPTMRPHEAVIVIESRLRAGSAIRREAERLLALAEAQEAEALAEVASALGQAAAEMALGFVRMAGDPVEPGHADIEAIPGLVDRVVPSWFRTGSTGLAEDRSGDGSPEVPLPAPEARAPARAVAARAPTASSIPPADAHEARDDGPSPAPQGSPSPVRIPEPPLGTPPTDGDFEVNGVHAPDPSPTTDTLGQPVIPTYRPDRPLTEAERKVLIDSLTPETFNYDGLTGHMRLLRPKGTVIQPWLPLPPFPKAGKDKDVKYLDVKIRANQRHELQDVVHDALYIAHASRLDLCVLYDKCMGHGVWRRKVFRAVLVHETGLELAPPKSANARRREASEADDESLSVLARETARGVPPDAVAVSVPTEPMAAAAAKAPPDTVPDTRVGIAVPSFVPDGEPAFEIPVALPGTALRPAPFDAFELVGELVEDGGHDLEPGLEPDLDEGPGGLEHPDEYDPRDHLAHADDESGDDPDDGGDPYWHPDDDVEDDAVTPLPRGDVAGTGVAVQATPPALSGTFDGNRSRSMRLAMWANPYPEIDLDRPPPRTILDDLPYDVARRLGVLPATGDAGSPPPIADDGTVGIPAAYDADAIHRPDGAIQRAANEARLAACPPAKRARLAAALTALTGVQVSWTPTPPGIRGDGNLPPLDPATVGPSPFPRITEPPFEYGHVYNRGVRAVEGYEQAFADARANRHMTPPPANACGG